jgi:hypothetical protein
VWEDRAKAGQAEYGARKAAPAGHQSQLQKKERILKIVKQHSRLDETEWVVEVAAANSKHDASSSSPAPFILRKT